MSCLVFSDDVGREQVGDVLDQFRVVLAGLARLQVVGPVLRTLLGTVPHLATVVATDHATSPP